MMVSLYVAVAISLNLVVGESGLLSICQAAFYGIGAYTATLLTMNARCTFGVSTLGALVFASLMAIVIGLPALRLSGRLFCTCDSTFSDNPIQYSLQLGRAYKRAQWYSRSSGASSIRHRVEHSL